MPSKPQSASAARKFVRRYLAYADPGASEDHVYAVTVVMSELVTNAVRYGTEPGDSVRITIDVTARRTRVEVHDAVRRYPRPRPESRTRERGRGLVVLNALCPGAWGVTDRPFGKAVWAEVTA
ncbi:ATP-binding protein [Streptomyces sp. B-S-A8]|uniref:ATP-binding protein n=1 Tax=Streptomyces solicavernae TaxID=3043614 RepID=A0ABT6RZJ9_9ACTN|nr:ATP-binding protein [Streptomyces sp. B-S-A8]MDI3389081.1 ATP-binding protein [Streptomyces sp. B-S-A8]